MKGQTVCEYWSGAKLILKKRGRWLPVKVRKLQKKWSPGE